ncbi:ThuA domain-containing protein [Prosthecobacter sp. SYSU 5D2]|uniref:ThuA domain-containing protein n=1 Tax=Prosthecobacter sp. SYSU 5D2 TaxID=3134134 RepID=UPI0031FE9C4F
MKPILPALLLLACTLVWTSLAAPGTPLRILIIDGQNNHKWDITTPVLKHALESCGAFSVEVSTTPPKGSPAEAWAGWKPAFGQYAAIVSNYNGEPWPEAVRKDFDGYVKGGGGFVSVHAANNSFPEWKEYNQMIGVGGWGGRDEKSGPWLYVKEGKLYRDTSTGKGGAHGPQHEFVVEIQDAAHPITRGLPKRWLHAQDELYSRLRGPAENIKILTSAKSDLTAEQEPNLMVLDYGQGRVFHTTLGHADYSMLCRGFYETFQRGTEWAATGDVKQTADIPSDFPSENQLSVVELEGHPKQPRPVAKKP